MTESKSVNELFDMLAKALLRCVGLGYVLLLLWIATYLFAGNAIDGQMLGLTSHEVDVIHYCQIAAVKCVVLLFLLFPCIAIRLVFRKRS